MDSVSEEPVLTQLIYTSAACEPFSEDDLRELLAKARAANSKLQVTGILLYCNEMFFQVLEGREQSVVDLYHRIQGDARHAHVEMLVRRQVPQRNFGEWSMGYVRDFDSLEQLPGYVDFFSGEGTVDLEGNFRVIEGILKKFRMGVWNRTPHTV